MAVTAIQSGSGFTSIQNLEAQMATAEENLPEGSLVQLQMSINEVYVPLEGMVSPAQFFATQINNYVKSHNVQVDNETIKPWPGNTVIAFGDDTASTLTVKWVKGQAFLAVVIDMFLQILPYVVAAIAAYELIQLIGHWVFGSQTSAATSPLNPKNIPVELGILAVLVLGPLIVRETGSIIGAERRYERQVLGR